MKQYLLIIMALIMVACGSGKPIAEWKDTSHRQLESYKKNFLTDKEDATEPHFVKAKEAISASNDLDLLAKAYLTRMALQVAVLGDVDDSDFLTAEKLQPSAANRIYYSFIKGDFSMLPDNDLPQPYNRLKKSIMTKEAAAAAREIAAIDNPLSRLIACGVWIKYLPNDESILQIAIATSAEQGWRRPLWSYLNRLQNYYLEHNEAAKAQSIKERLELLKK